MKTLKKTLCLILAVVMVVGVLILPAYAADDYTAAITALQNYKVLQGKGDGLIHADDPVTRADMAAIVYRIMTGDTEPAATANQKADAKYGAYADKFKDLTANDQWAKGYIGFCANQGVLKGDEKGNVKPNQQIIGYEVQAMLLRAIGYDKNNEYTGSNWEYKVLADATKTGISKGVSTDPANKTPRGAVAQLTVNAAINADRVAPSVYPTVGYTSLGQSLMEVGATAKDYDIWGAPSTVYTVTYTWPDYDVTTNPVVADKALLESWEPVTQAAAFKAAGLTGSSGSLTSYTNTQTGSESLTATDANLATAIGGQGRWTRVYKDRIVYVDTFLSKVTAVTDEVKVNGVTAIDPEYTTTTYYPVSGPTAQTAAITVQKTAAPFAKYTMLSSYGKASAASLASANQITALVDAAKVATATVTVNAIVKDTSNNVTGFIGTNGKTYLYNCTYAYNGGYDDGTGSPDGADRLNDTAIGKTFTLYLDAKGNVLGVEPAANTDSKGIGVVLSGTSGQIGAGKYYGELTVLTDKNTQVKVKFINLTAAGITKTDNKPYTTADEAAINAELLVGNLISWDADTAAAKASPAYPGYSALTVYGTTAGTPDDVTGNKFEAGDADALGTSKLVNDNTVFFVANYDYSASKGGYTFTNYSVVTGFQALKDMGCTGTVIDNPNAKAANDKIQYESTVAVSNFVSHVLIINAVNKSNDTVVPVDNYAFLADPTAFVKVYEKYYQYDAAINGTAHQPLKVQYVATSAIAATGLYTYKDIDTNGSWGAVTLSKNLLDGGTSNYTYNAGVISVLQVGDSTKVQNSTTPYLTVAKGASIYLVNPATGNCTKVDADLGTVEKAYGAAANKVWFQLNQYGWINVIYVETPDTGSAGPNAPTALASVTLTVNGAAAPKVGDYVKDFNLGDTITTNPTSGTFNGKVNATLTWLKLNDSGEYVPYTAEAFVAGTYRVKISMSVTNAAGQNYTVGDTTTITVNGTAVDGKFTGAKGANIISAIIEIPAAAAG